MGHAIVLTQLTHHRQSSRPPPHPTPPPSTRRYWLDILFNDQNAEDMTGQLDAAELVYRGARFHYALMLNDPMSRGWCLFELLVRILAGMAALGIARPEDLVPRILSRDPLFTRLVIVEGLTIIEHDVTGTFYDRFGRMSTFDPRDMAAIKRAVVAACGSAAAFNLLVSCYRRAAILNLRQVGAGGLQWGVWRASEGRALGVRAHASPARGHRDSEVSRNAQAAAAGAPAAQLRVGLRRAGGGGARRRRSGDGGPGGERRSRKREEGRRWGRVTLREGDRGGGWGGGGVTDSGGELPLRAISGRVVEGGAVGRG
jgi:hypothetical protein